MDFLNKTGAVACCGGIYKKAPCKPIILKTPIKDIKLPEPLILCGFQGFSPIC